MTALLIVAYLLALVAASGLGSALHRRDRAGALTMVTALAVGLALVIATAYSIGATT